MKRLVVVLALIAVMGTLFTLAPSITQAEHETESEVEATVSVSVISLSASSTGPTSTDYGPLHLGEFDNQPLEQFRSDLTNCPVSVLGTGCGHQSSARTKGRLPLDNGP